ncbi:MAG: phosphoribosylformylglycinamidine synthase, partial [Clostridia bacterium]|nr:phosphoribosylformylglycinamidine synthase [Clostridia bacterium]
PERNVRRERPEPGDVVILLGGRTGRDGCGGATGSSKSHTLSSLTTCGAEVQKGNAPEERKLQRLFRNGEASRLIKRCNDFGAGGVSVAIGELADGLLIDLNAVPKKYDGLDGTELAISESQERMAVVVAPEDAARFQQIAESENLESTVVATVQAEPRLVMTWNGVKVVDISREFLNSNGAEKHIDITPSDPLPFDKAVGTDFASELRSLASDLNVCSKRGLSERFDSTIGRGTVLMPFGGKYQQTPIQAMVHKVSAEQGKTNTVSYMAWGFNPYISEKSPYHGAYLAVIESVSKLIAAGAKFEDVYLTFQEYFEKPMRDGKRWGKPLSALLGAFEAQMHLGIAAIGGKDSMSGTFEQIDVPPTLVSFAVTTGDVRDVVTPEFKAAGHRVCLLAPETDENGLPKTESLLSLYERVTALMRAGKVYAAYTPTFGGIAEAVLKSAIGNGVGFAFDAGLSMRDIFGYRYGAFLLETDEEIGTPIGRTTDDGCISYGGEALALDALQRAYEQKLEPVFPCETDVKCKSVRDITYTADSRVSPALHIAQPRVLIPVFPGTNCEFDTAKALAAAGAKPEIFVINNLTSAGITQSVERFAEMLDGAQIVFIPGGFSGGDEPDGSGKFITAFFRNARIKEGVTRLLEARDGLMCGICNGFQALVKLGLVPFGKIIDTDESCPTLTYNDIGRHQSRVVQTRIASNKSPWLMETQPGEVYNVPISHGEGKFIVSDAMLEQLSANGQIATQYVDLNGSATMDVRFNPNGSVCAIEGITSPDGRVLGKMGHTERYEDGLYQNVPGNYDPGLFRSAVRYFA